MREFYKRKIFVLFFSVILAMNVIGCKADTTTPNDSAADSLSEVTSPNDSAVDSLSEVTSTNDSAVNSLSEITSTCDDAEESVGKTASSSDVVENADDFSINEIDDELFNKIYGYSFKEDCTIPREDLRYLKVLYVDFSGNTQQGELIVNKQIAQDVLEVMQALYENKYPIEKIRLIDEYGAIDEDSMADNNTSAFNFRFVANTTSVSKHGAGMAIDINPLYNPCVSKRGESGEELVEPANGVDYVNRELDFEHKITHEDLAYKLFTEHGFTWGGDWNSLKDYQHFEKATQ